jgi:hypothetical protein
VVIHDFDTVRIAVPSAESGAPLVVDADAVAAHAAALQSFQAIDGPDPQVIQHSGAVEHAQLALGDMR